MKQRLRCLAQGHNTVHPMSLKLVTFDPKSYTPPKESLHSSRLIMRGSKKIFSEGSNFFDIFLID